MGTPPWEAIFFSGKKQKVLWIAWNGDNRFALPPRHACRKIPLLSIGGWSEGQVCADPEARFPIGISGIFLSIIDFFYKSFIQVLINVIWKRATIPKLNLVESLRKLHIFVFVNKWPLSLVTNWKVDSWKVLHQLPSIMNYWGPFGWSCSIADRKQYHLKWIFGTFYKNKRNLCL